MSPCGFTSASVTGQKNDPTSAPFPIDRRRSASAALPHFFTNCRHDLSRLRRRGKAVIGRVFQPFGHLSPGRFETRRREPAPFRSWL